MSCWNTCARSCCAATEASCPRCRRDASLSELFAAVGTQRRAQRPGRPAQVLAELPCPIYITTNANNLLEEALKAAGKDPQTELCRWNEDVEQLPSIYDDDPDYRPSIERPLVYHLFGVNDEPDSLVLTEDDYFDYLIGVTTNKDLIPIAVRQALADTALLFLGFRIDDWNFRVLFRSIMSQEGAQPRAGKYAHVAVQIDPGGGPLPRAGARAPLPGTYFQDAAYQHLLGQRRGLRKELLAQWNAEPDKQPPAAR